jgi:dihydrodipicolinate synthase/N-acetylneuraminate lyase
MSQKFTVEHLRGVIAVTPTPALPGAEALDATNTVDLVEADRMIRALVRDGVDGIMTNGTLGEMATLTEDEWKQFAATVSGAMAEVAPEMPLFIGATAPNSRDTAARIRFLHGLGVRGVFLGRPMWSALGPDALYEYYRTLAAAFPDMAFVLYDNPEAFKGAIPPGVYAQLAKLPQIVGAKYTAITPKYTADMYAVGDGVRLMPIESDWFVAHSLFPERVSACWSSSALCGPEPVVLLRDLIVSGQADSARELTHRMEWAYEPLLARTNFAEFSKYNIALEKTRFDEAGYVKAGPTRPPYHIAPEPYLEGARENGRRWRRIIDELN